MSIISLTPRAIKQFEQIMALPDAKDASGIKLSVPPQGCSGFSYKLDFAKDVDDADEKIELENGLSFYIDKLAIMYVMGTEIDYDDTDLMAPGFKFKNPLEAGSCGCGESFIVDKDKLSQALEEKA